MKNAATSEEKKAELARERAAFVKLYNETQTRIFAKRHAGKASFRSDSTGELDDELLGLAQTLLEKNPDVYTFWNIRREVLLAKKAALQVTCLVLSTSVLEGRCRDSFEGLRRFAQWRALPYAGLH